MAETKTISRATYLQALGLFTLGHSYSERADEVRKELRQLLQIGDELGDHVTDEMYAYGHADFDDALKREGISVEGGADGPQA